MADLADSNVDATRELPGVLAARIAVALGAIALVRLETIRFGPALSPDSASYLSIASSLASGAGFSMTGLGPTAYWPPLFPLLVSVAYPLGVDSIAWAGALNALLHGAVVFTAPLILPAPIRPWPVSLGVTVLVALAPPLLLVARFMWSEALFIALVIVSLATLARSLVDRGWGWLCLAAVCAALASLARYAGAAVILTGALCLLAGCSGARGRAVGRAAIFAVIAGLPLFAWLVRNRIVTGTLTGYRERADESILVHLARFQGILLDWVAPGTRSIVPVIASLTILAVVAASLCAADAEGRARLGERLRAATPVLVFLGIYSAWMVASTSLVLLTALDDRYLAPLFVPLAAIVLLILHWVSGLSPAHRRARGGIAIAIVAVWILRVGVLTAQEVRVLVAQGAGGYATTEWMESALTHHLRAHPPEGLVYANDPSAFFVFVRRFAAQSPKAGPEDRLLCSSEVVEMLRPLRGGQPVFLVWWNHAWGNGGLLGPPALGSIADLEPLITTSDGHLFRLTASPARAQALRSSACEERDLPRR